MRKRNAKEAVVLKLVDHIRVDEPRVGTRKLYHHLLNGSSGSKKLTGRDALFNLLRKTGRLVKQKKSFQKTTYSRHSYAVAPNRVKALEITKTHQVVVSDCTYIRLGGREKFAYLFLVTDLYSRMIVGYHLSRDLTHYSALIALDNAVKLLKNTDGIIHHSDRGCQYCCHEYLAFLEGHKMISSMTDENHCYQNAVAERVNGILKDEFNLDETFDTFEQARLAITRTVMVYNTKRIHYSLELRTPMEVFLKKAAG